MPVALSYPGVYIEELESPIHSIAGVATSITAFVGRAVRGPIDADEKSPARVTSFGEYDRLFGGLSNDCPMSFAVAHFFANGGGDALIVRVHNGAQTAASAAAPIFVAANPGAWGAKLRIRIDLDIDPEIENPVATRFNLRVKDLGTGTIETFLNLSTDPTHPRFASQVLADQSRLIRGPASFAALPTANTAAAAGTPDPFDDATATALAIASAKPDGDPVVATQISDPSLQGPKQGLYALEKADLFNLLVIPPFSAATDVDKATWDAASAYCATRRALVLVDPPFNASGWDAVDDVTATAITGVAARSANAALYFPRIRCPNPLRQNRVEPFAPGGAVAGLIARTDANRGVWKAPAGIEATLSGVTALDVSLTDKENGFINPLGVNCLRSFPTTGPIAWGARTLRGADSLTDQWKYLPVRRLALFLEESLYRGTQWVVFEPNDEPLWAQIRLNLGSFLNTLFRQGAFQGGTPKEAFFVKCDKETTTQADIDNGIVNVVVGFAPLKPAEFVVIQIQQIAQAQ